MRIIVLLALIGLCYYSQAQLTDARKHVDTLCSDDMAGRGYVDQGHVKAAQYIADQFAEVGLQKLDSSYFQYFNFDINTFPGDLKLNYSWKGFSAGKHFIPKAFSGPAKGRGKVVFIDSAALQTAGEQAEFLNEKIEKRILVYDKGGYEHLQNLPMQYFDHAMQSEVQIELKPRLMASYSSRQFDGAAFDLLDSLFDPEKDKRLRYKCESLWQEQLRSQNVLGYLSASKSNDSFLVVTAHYDHLGKMDEAIFYGANDNASGVAMLIELARYYAEHPAERHYNMLFIAFGGEEAGLLGSYHYVKNPFVSLNKMRFLLNLDLMGNGEDGITVVNGSVFENEMIMLEELNDEHQWLSKLKRRGAAANSDHYPFSERGVPSFFFYTMGGKPWYHDVYDQPEALTFARFESTIALIRAFFEGL